MIYDIPGDEFIYEGVKTIPERIHSKLGKNDGYWEHYWESVSEVGHDVVREYSLENTHSDGESTKNDAQGGV